MVITRLQEKQIFREETQRLSCIHSEQSDSSILFLEPIVYRPLFRSAMTEQFMNNIVKGQIKTLTKFGGADTEDVVKWLQDMEAVFDRVKLEPSDKFIAIQCYLTKAAEKWFRFNAANIKDWATFKVEIVKVHQPSLHQILLQMEQRYQEPGEKVIEYYHDKHRLCLQADPDMSLSMIIHHLTKGLHASLLPHVLRRNPTTPSEFLTIAQGEEKLHITVNGLSHGSSSASDNYFNDDTPNDHMVNLVNRPANTQARPSHWRQHASSPQPLMNLSLASPSSL